MLRFAPSLSVCLRVTLPVLFALPMAGARLRAETAPTSHAISLDTASVSIVSDTRVVVSMNATGDLRGLLTLTMDLDQNGEMTGEWSLTAQYAQYVDASGQPVVQTPPPDEGQPVGGHLHSEGILQLVNKGSLSGRITAGTLTRDENGTITGVDGVVLTITSGILTYDGASGTGGMTVWSAQDAAASHGNLVLTF